MSNVGTDFSPEDCITILESQLKNTVKDISSLTTKNKDLYTEYLCNSCSFCTKRNYEHVKKWFANRLSGNKNISCQLKNVPDALSGTSACAFYLVPPIDSTKDNIIYINKSRVDSNELFSTLAHEGYPGHLYQTNYFLTTNPSPLRTFLHCAGYDEGWELTLSYTAITLLNLKMSMNKQQSSSASFTGIMTCSRYPYPLSAICM